MGSDRPTLQRRPHQTRLRRTNRGAPAHHDLGPTGLRDVAAGRSRWWWDRQHHHPDRTHGQERPPVTDASPALTAALSDRYRIARELGQGGLALVFME